MDKLLNRLKALGDETRLEIVRLLLTHDLCVGAIANRLQISKAAVSQHLKVLREADIVRGEKRGYWMHYKVNLGTLKKTGESLRALANSKIEPEHGCFRVQVANLGSNKVKLRKRREKEMCKCCCEHPEKLKGKPEDCSPEQIKECHGDSGEHPCMTKKEE